MRRTCACTWADLQAGWLTPQAPGAAPPIHPLREVPWKGLRTHNPGNQGPGLKPTLMRRNFRRWTVLPAGGHRVTTQTSPKPQPHFRPPRCSSTSQESAAEVGLPTDQPGSRLFPILTFCSWTPYSHLEIRSICSSTHSFPPGRSSPRKEGDSKESFKCTPNLCSLPFQA